MLESLRAATNGEHYIDPTIAAKLLLPIAPLLPPREREVLALLACGTRIEAIAQKLSLSQETVKAHASRVFSKLGKQTRPGAVAHRFGSGLPA